MDEKAFQDYYPDDYNHCYGCGQLNDYGLKVRSFWDGEETIARYMPEAYHIAAPGFVYGGLLASLIDCHGTATAAAATYRAEDRPMGSDPPLRFVTASLKINYLRPTPLGVPLEIRGKIREVRGRKATIEASVIAEGKVCVTGEVVAVQMPDSMKREP